MSNVYDMSGKKKVIKTEEPGLDISYKEIMQIIIIQKENKINFQEIMVEMEIILVKNI